LLKGDPAALAVLVDLLKDRDPKFRRIAAQGLEAIGPAARPALREALHDRDGKVRASAEEILDRIESSAASAEGK
jgi:HEAT repeat protein